MTALNCHVIFKFGCCGDFSAISIDKFVEFCTCHWCSELKNSQEGKLEKNKVDSLSLTLPNIWKLNSEADTEHGKQLKIELGTTRLLIYVQNTCGILYT
jgi:hypothetical protein